MEARAPEAAAERRTLAFLLITAALLFTVNTTNQALPAVDDCFYARKAVEMARRGFSLTVTWADAPAFQNPPAQFWLVGAAFRLLGENDFAARLPSAAMAVGILFLTWRIGHIVVGGQAPLVAVALLLLSPGYSHNARRVMMEIPLTFWTAVSVLAFLEGLTRRRWLMLVAVGIAAAILTKGLLGLLPILVIGSALLVPDWRGAMRGPCVWIAVLAGLALGSVWTIDQAQRYDTFVQAHYADETFGRARQPTTLAQVAVTYPQILLQFYQPIILPALVGIGLVWRRWRAHRCPGILIAAWVLLPIVLYSFASARASRYVFPTFPALALCAAVAVVRFVPRLVPVLTRFIAPAAVLVATLIFAIRPEILSRPGTQPFKEHAPMLRNTLPPEHRVPYLGSRYWNQANPLMYYCERLLAPPSASAQEAIAQAATSPSRVLLADRDQVQGILALAPRAEALVDTPGWALLRIGDAGGP